MMNSIFLIFLFLIQNWSQIPKENIKIETKYFMFSHEEELSKKNYGKLNVLGACGGTGALGFDTLDIKYSQEENKIKIYAELIDKETNEKYLFPRMILATVREDNDIYIPKSKIIKQLDATNVIAGEFNYTSNQNIYIWGLGSTVLEINIEI
ncbi:hypothetical protein KFE94_16235 [bacterium SCSIO 12643]|nr:hypothetical protein KFE94_16235 [bacterium SCSIO 12643]